MAQNDNSAGQILQALSSLNLSPEQLVEYALQSPKSMMELVMRGPAISTVDLGYAEQEPDGIKQRARRSTGAVERRGSAPSAEASSHQALRPKD